MAFFITLILTFMVVSIVLFTLFRLGAPVYRIEAANVITLLEMVLSATASDSDWNVFLQLPVYHDPELEKIRLWCEEISEREMLGDRDPVIFSPRGYLELQEVLSELLLKQEDDG